MRNLEQRKLLLATVAAAGLGLASLTLPAGAADPADRPASDRPAAAAAHAEPLALPPGFTAKNVDADSGVRSGLVKLTERAVSKGDFNKFLAELTAPAKKEAREFKNADQAKLDSIIDQIQKNWKTKYGQDFNINDKNLVFDQRFPIAQGEVSDPTVARNNWPVPATASEAITAGGRNKPADSKEENARESELSKGRDVALIRFPASHALPQMTVSMLKERMIVGFWKIDVPDDRTGEKIYNDLADHLTYIRDHQADWPADVADGYRMVAHHAVAALYGVPAHTHGG